MCCCACIAKTPLLPPPTQPTIGSEAQLVYGHAREGVPPPKLYFEAPLAELHMPMLPPWAMQAKQGRA